MDRAHQEQRDAEEDALRAKVQEGTRLLWYDEPEQAIRERKSALGDWLVWVCAPDAKRHIPLTARGDTKIEALTELLVVTQRALRDLLPHLLARSSSIQTILHDDKD